MHKTKDVKNVVFLIVLLVLITGCAPMQMYPGQRLPRDQVALIKCITTHEHLIYQENLCIVTLDGVKPTRNEIEVLPSEHTLEIELIKVSTQPLWAVPIVLAVHAFQKPFITTPLILTFRAEAGQEYRVDGKRVPDEKYDRWLVWVEDVKTGAVVGGRKPDTTESKKDYNIDQNSDNEDIFN